jgi:hypothetical protein
LDNTNTATYTFTPAAGQCATTAQITITVLQTISSPTGNSQQLLSQGKEVKDIVIQKDPNGVIEWYKNQADALAQVNALLPSDILESGNYYAMQTIGGCRSTTPLEIAVTATLGVDKFDTTGLSYYPNPVIDILTVSYNHEISTIEVFNVLGQQIMTVRPNSENTTIDMAGLPRGAYLLQVNSEGKTAVIKVIKK